MGGGVVKAARYIGGFDNLGEITVSKPLKGLKDLDGEVEAGVVYPKYVDGEIQSALPVNNINEVNGSVNTNYRYHLDGQVRAQIEYDVVGSIMYSTPGTYTFTVPDGVTQLRAIIVGGGAGAMCIHSAYETVHYSGWRYGDAGNSSSIKYLPNNAIYSSNSGSASRAYMRYGWDGEGYASVSSFSYSISYGERNGNYRYESECINIAGAASFNVSTGYYGGGGSLYASLQRIYAFCFVGASGYLRDLYLNVMPGSTFSITVGSGGYGKSYRGDYSNTNATAYNGGNGCVYFEWNQHVIKN